ncbi:MAG: hypothetical protein ACI8QZ_000967 [Chlamydiales bacterium]|jgi:hypothetical protein
MAPKDDHGPVEDPKEPDPAEDYTTFGERFGEAVSGAPRLDLMLPAIDAAAQLDPDGADPATRHMTSGVPVAGSLPKIPGVTLGAVIGQGGQGTVYRGRQTYVDRDVAVKVLASGANANFADRFRREARLLAGMQHPSVVACYDAGISADGHCFITMEFIDGPDLAACIQSSGAFGTREALELARDVAGALEYALGNGVIHRDVKPQNVLLKACRADGGDGSALQPKLADLGLARVTGDQDGQARLTVPGSVMGTPATMALEQFDDPDSVDHRADIYGLGCVLYFALAGKSAYRGLRPLQVFKKKAQEPAPDIRADVPGIAPGVAELVHCMMDGDRERRPQSYAELIARIDAELALPEAPPVSVRRGRLVGVLGALALVAVATTWFVGPGSRTVAPGDPTVGPGSQARPIEAPVIVPPADASSADEMEQPGGQAPALTPGSETTLFAGWEDEQQLLNGWKTNPTDVWKGFSADYSQPMAHIASGVATATRHVPGGSWQLTGEVRVFPIDGQPKDSTFRGGLRIGFAGGRALELAVNLVDRKGAASWVVSQPEGEGRVSSDSVGPETMSFERGKWIPFRIDSESVGVRLQIGPEGSSLPSIKLAALELTGPATTLTLVAQGNVIWRNFVLRGL